MCFQRLGPNVPLLADGNLDGVVMVDGAVLVALSGWAVEERLEDARRGGRCARRFPDLHLAIGLLGAIESV